VLGALCGTIGSVMATEAVKLITGAGRTLLGRLAVYDALELTWRHLTVRPDPTRSAVTVLPDDAAYAAFCGLSPAAGAPASTTTAPRELADLRAAAAAGDAPEPFVLDVREPWEVQVAALDGAYAVPSGAFAVADREGVVADVARRADGRPVHVLCKAGPRAARVAAVLRDAGVDAREVTGGIAAWSRDVDPSVPTY
jgi:adenylyltransferase/sulfurtransferase